MNRRAAKLVLGTALLAATPAAAQLPRATWDPGSSSVTEQEIIPPAYRGAWAPTAEQCGNENNIGRIVIYPNGVDVGEAGGRLEQVTQGRQDRSVRLRLAFEGEGRFWDLVWTLTLNRDGQQLTLVSGESVPDLLIRCPQR
jgi:hypothetical protein